MIKTLDKSGKTIDLALEEALKELGLSKDDLSYHYEVVQQAKSGFLGIGAQSAIVRVSYEVPDPKPEVKAAPKAEPKTEAKTEEKVEPKAPKAERRVESVKAAETVPKAVETAPVIDENDEYAAVRSFLTGLLGRMGVKADIEIAPRDNGGINVNLSGSGMGAIIGRRGETLDAIQHLTNYVVNRGSDKHMHISVDAESYRAKREESLTKLAEKMAEKAIKYKRSMALEPMNSYERHVIHTALQNYEGVTTNSTGVEPNRRVVVSYVRPETPASNKPQSREWA